MNRSLLVSLVASLAMLACTAPLVSAYRGQPGAASSASRASSSPGVVLPKPAETTARASSGYLNVDNCWQALNGANGDNDVLAWIYSHTPYGITSSGYGGYTRYNSTRVIVWVDFWVYSRWWGNRAGYCMGSNSSIVDKVDDPPSGW